MRIMWSLTYRCNFKCNYCYIEFDKYKIDILNDSNLNLIIDFFNKLSLKKSISLHIIGGEISLFPQSVLHIIEYLNRKFDIIIYTNLSNISFIKKIINKGYNKNVIICTSYHYNKIDIIKYEKGLQLLNDYFQYSTCLLMVEPKYVLQIIQYYEKWNNTFPNIKFSNKGINDALKIISIEIKNKLNVYKDVFIDENKSINLYDTKNDELKFNGYVCEVPMSGFYINPLGQLYSCENYCYYKQPFLYDVLTQDSDMIIENIIDKKTICEVEHCTHCGHYYKKYKKDEN